MEYVEIERDRQGWVDFPGGDGLRRSLWDGAMSACKNNLKKRITKLFSLLEDLGSKEDT